MDELKVALLILILILVLVLLIREWRTRTRVGNLESFRETDSKMLKDLKSEFENRELRFATMVDGSLKRQLIPVFERLTNQDKGVAEIKDMVETLVNRGTNDNTPPPPSSSKASSG